MGSALRDCLQKSPTGKKDTQPKLLLLNGVFQKMAKSKPVIVFEPVEFDGATVTRCTSYNAKYITDNHICPNAYKWLQEVEMLFPNTWKH